MFRKYHENEYLEKKASFVKFIFFFLFFFRFTEIDRAKESITKKDMWRRMVMKMKTKYSIENIPEGGGSKVASISPSQALHG